MNCRRLKKPKKHHDWLELRKKGLTGTDIAAIAGESPYESALSVYANKLSMLPPKAENEAMAVGTFMEDPITSLWLKRNPDAKVRKVPYVLQHQDHDWMLGNIDRHIIAPSEGVLEIKCVGPNAMRGWGSEDEPKIPTQYHLQVMWYLMVCGLRDCRIAALLGGTQLIERVVTYDKEMAEAIMEISHQFWFDHIKKGVPPAIDDSQATTTALSGMFANPQERELVIPNLSPWLQRYDVVTAKIKELEKEKEGITNNLKAMIGDQCVVASCLDRSVSWKPTTTNRFDTKTFKTDYPALYERYTKPTTSRRLLVK